MSGLSPIDPNVDHIRGPDGSPLIIEYGDYECPYSRAAYRAIQTLAAERAGQLQFVFRHYPLTDVHPHALAAAHAAEAASLQGRFGEMHDLLYRNQRSLEDAALREYAIRAGLEVASFDRDRDSVAVRSRVQRDVDSGNATGDVMGTPTLFIDGVVYRGDLDAASLAAALAGASAPK